MAIKTDKIQGIAGAPVDFDVAPTVNGAPLGVRVPAAEDYSEFYVNEQFVFGSINTAFEDHTEAINPHGQYLLGLGVFDESVDLGPVKSVKLVGEGVTATVSNGQATLTIPGGGSGGVAGVSSFNGRAGAVLPKASDYDEFFVTPSEITDTARAYTKTQAVQPVSVPFAPTLSTNGQSSNYFIIGTLTGNATLANPTDLVLGATYIFEFTQDATGNRAVTFGSVFRLMGGAMGIDLGANARTVCSGLYNGTQINLFVGKETAA